MLFAEDDGVPVLFMSNDGVWPTSDEILLLSLSLPAAVVKPIADGIIGLLMRNGEEGSKEGFPIFFFLTVEPLLLLLILPEDFK